jgi:hypothetical protein
MITELVAGSNHSEFELRRLNLSTFRLLEVMLGLMMKAAKSTGGEYTYENVLSLYEKTYHLAEILSTLFSTDMNDTIRLSLLLKKLKILLLLKKLVAAETLLEEINKMSDLLLKNKRVLLYMEEESNLLAYYKQVYLNLKSEYYFLKSEQSEKHNGEYLELCKICIWEMMVGSSNI